MKGMISLTDNRNNRIPVGRCQQECVVFDTDQVFDSCRDRDCFEDVRVYLDELGQSIIEHTTQVRTRSASICGSSISVEPVQLSRGFSRVTVRYYVKLELEACLTGSSCGCGQGNSFGSRVQGFTGIAAVEKSVVLYGGEGCVHVFRSNEAGDGFCQKPCCGEMGSNLPTAVVETVDPVILGTRVVDPATVCCCCCCLSDIPAMVSESIGNLCEEGSRYLAISLGFFSVIRLERPGQFIVNAIEYSVPDKECVQADEGSPCDAFRRMAFPFEEFAPGKAAPAVCERTDRGGDKGDNCRCSTH